MGIEIREAKTTRELEAIYRLRHRICVEEKAWRKLADDGPGFVRDDRDATAHNFYALVDGELVGALRVHWGGDAPLAKRLVDEFGLEPLIELLGHEDLLVMDRFVVLPEHRGGPVPMQLRAHACAFGVERAELAFLCCEPHMIGVYEKVGFRICGDSYVPASLSTLVVPMVIVRSDVAHLERVGSPFVGLARQYPRHAKLEAINALLPARGEHNAQLGTDACWEEILRLLHQRPAGACLLEGFSDDEIRKLLARSRRLRCPRGGLLIRKDHSPNTLFVVLSGTVEARLEDRRVGIVEAGDCIGEIAFLHGLHRTADVYALTDDVEVLSLHRDLLKDLFDADPKVAARFLHNLSKSLCLRLMGANLRIQASRRPDPEPATARETACFVPPPHEGRSPAQGAR